MSQLEPAPSKRRRKPRGLVPLPAQGAADTARRRLLRWALDLHDGPLQDLAALGFMLSRLHQKLEAIPGAGEARSDVDEIQHQLVVLERALRSLASDDDPGLVGLTVPEIVKGEAVRFEGLCSADLQVRLDPDVDLATASQAIALQRILREALSNIARHSRAATADVEIAETVDGIEMTVRDDGIGFEPASIVRGGDRPRLGLAGIRQRLQLLDGALVVDSRPGGPTLVRVVIPRWRPDGVA